MLTPKVSIILTTYNGGTRGYLTQAIESVLKQTFQDFEFLVVDDGSTDDTKAVCKPYVETWDIAYIQHENKGLAGARNTGIRAASGEYICFIDDDDTWKPDKLQRQLEFIAVELKDVDKWGLIFTWIELIDRGGKIIGYRGHHESGEIYRSLLFGNKIDAPSSVLVKSEVFDKVGLFDEFFRSCQDWDMWLRISKDYLIFPVKEYLVQHREHKNRISANSNKVFFYEKAFLEKALTNAPNDINPREIYAKCYLNRSKVFFANDEYSQFRQVLLAGAKMSPKMVTLEHLFLLLISFLGKNTINTLKLIKRYLQKVMI